MVLWDFDIQTEKLVMTNQLDMVVVDKQRKKAIVIAVAMPSKEEASCVPAASFSFWVYLKDWSYSSSLDLQKQPQQSSGVESKQPKHSLL